MLQSTVVDALQGGREGSWRIYFNDNVNPNDNELSTECVLQVIESPCRREIGQIKIESYKMREEDKGDGLIQSNSGWFMSHLILLSCERPAGTPLFMLE